MLNIGSYSSIADISATLVQRWTQLTLPLPPLDDLVTYIQGPLAEDDKIPPSEYFMMQFTSFQVNPRAMCNLDNVKWLSRLSEDEQADVLWTIVKLSLMFSLPDNDSTESAFHIFWDGNIQRLLEVTILCRTIWDSNEQMSTALLRLDFWVLIDSVCAFRDKEKAPRYHGPHPKYELIQKLTWTYDPAPYKAIFLVGVWCTYPSLLDWCSFTRVIMPSHPLLCLQLFRDLWLLTWLSLIFHGAHGA